MKRRKLKIVFVDKTKIDGNDCKDYDWSILLKTLWPVIYGPV